MNIYILLFSLSFSVITTRSDVINVGPVPAGSRLFCYYDSSSSIKEGYGKLIIDNVKPAMENCDYLIYGYAGIDASNHRAISLNSNLDLDEGKGLYRKVTHLKRTYPNLRVLLGIGGDKDVPLNANEGNKYIALLENIEGRKQFVDSLHALVYTYGFDGVDLAWQFIKNKPKKVHSTVGGWFKSVKKLVTGDFNIDPKSDEHKEQFTALLRSVKDKFRADNFLLTTTVLPNVNSTRYMDVVAIKNYVDFVNLCAFDFQTPARNPEEADYTAPLYALPERNPEFNVDYQVKYWTRNGFPEDKLNLGIATHARVWKLKEKPDDNAAATPPLRKVVEHSAPIGEESKQQGLYSYAETCTLLNEQGKGKLSTATDVRNACNYAFRVPDKHNEGGLWLSYESPNTAVTKAAYVRENHLSGVALYDLAYDDFRGACDDKYPILRAIKYRLTH